jgi:hypothetical protein
VTAALGSSIAAYYDLPAWWTAFAGTTAYVMFGMTASYNGTEHWFSDTVAGALMGYAIGSSVGEGFRLDRGRGSLASNRANRASLSPLIYGGGAGLVVSFRLD